MKKLVLVALLGVAGCSRSPTFAEVEGTVKVNGRPLPNVVVQFLPDPQKDTRGPSSSAVTDGQGRYRLRCNAEQEGAIVGWHRVVIEDPDEERPSQRQTARKEPRVPARYTRASTDLQKEVKAGKQTIDLNLTSP